MPCKTLHLLLIIQLALLPQLFSQTSEQLRDNLYAANADGSFSLYDGNLTMYSVSNSNTIDGMDAVKMLKSINLCAKLHRKASVFNKNVLRQKMLDCRCSLNA